VTIGPASAAGPLRCHEKLARLNELEAGRLTVHEIDHFPEVSRPRKVQARWQRRMGIHDLVALASRQEMCLEGSWIRVDSRGISTTSESISKLRMRQWSLASAVLVPDAPFLSWPAVVVSPLHVFYSELRAHCGMPRRSAFAYRSLRSVLKTPQLTIQ
jgi:hypothetical protein